jgi:S1-C subfamily serine protease
VDSELASYLGLDKAEGAVISGVLEGSPAEKAGLIEWDVIVGFNGEKVATADELVAAIKASQIGQEVKLTVIRQRQQQTITVTVAEKPVNVG